MIIRWFGGWSKVTSAFVFCWLHTTSSLGLNHRLAHLIDSKHLYLFPVLPPPSRRRGNRWVFFFLSGPRSFAYPKRKRCEQRERKRKKTKKRNSVMSGYWNVANGILVIQTSCVKCRNITDRPRLEHFGRISSKLVSIENFQPSNAWCCTLGLKRSLIVCWKGYRMVSELNEFELMCGS